MIIYELSASGFESHCSHLESLTYSRVSHKGSEGGGKVFDIFGFWSCWALICIELIDLISTKFFKEIVIVLRKMHAAGEIFVKICLKARYIFFFLICSSQSREGQEGWAWRKVIHLFFWWGRDITKWWEVSKIWVCALLLPAPFLVVNPVPKY